MEGLVIQGKHEMRTASKTKDAGCDSSKDVVTTTAAATTTTAKWSMNESALRRQRSEERRMLAARRRVLEQQVRDLVADAKSDDGEDDDGYEEICFGGDSSSKDAQTTPVDQAQQEHHYLTPISVLGQQQDSSSRLDTCIRNKSISDTDLLTIMDENREIELHLLTTPAVNETQQVTLFTDRTFAKEPEQGFYRVYDELERVKEWDLIPYVITRKARMQEEEEERKKHQNEEDEENKTVKVKPCASSSGSDKVSVKSVTSRVSVDSGRASVMSDNNNAKKNIVPRPQGSQHEDSGSNCSADSGTYNLYDEQQNAEFLTKVSQQLDSCLLRARSKSTASTISRRKRTPPPPPSLASRSSPSPPPLPPRSRTNSTAPNTRRKDLSSFFGLLQDEPNQLLSKQVASSVAMRNLTSTQTPLHRAVVPLKPAAIVAQERSPPGKKDLRKYLGIQDNNNTLTKTAIYQQQQQQQAGSGGSLLKCLGVASPASVLQRSLRKLSPKQLEFVSRKEEEENGRHEQVLDNVLVSPPPKRLQQQQPQNCARRVLDFDSSHLLQDSKNEGDDDEGVKLMPRSNSVFLVGNTPPQSSHVSKEGTTTKQPPPVALPPPPPPPQIQTNQSASRGEEGEAAKKHLLLPSSLAEAPPPQQQQQHPPPPRVAVEAVNKSIQTSPPPPPPPAPIHRPLSPKSNIPSSSQTPTNRHRRSGGVTRMLLLRSPAGHLLRGSSPGCTSRRARSPGGRVAKSSGSTPSSMRMRMRSSSRGGDGKRRSLMATLLSSASKKDAKMDVDREEEEKEEEVIPDSGRDYSRNVREAQRQGLPVIPFLNGSPVKQSPEENNNNDLKTFAERGCNFKDPALPSKGPDSVHPLPSRANILPGAADRGFPSFVGGASSSSRNGVTASSSAVSSDGKSLRQQPVSNPYLPMTPSRAPPPTQLPFKPTAKSGLCHTSNYAPHRMLNFGTTKPLSVWRDEEDDKRQHCQSCTCRDEQKGEDALSELDYVRMEKKGCHEEGQRRKSDDTMQF